MKTTRIKFTLALPLAFFVLILGRLHLRGDLWLAIAPSGTNALLTWSNSAALLERSLTLTGAWTTVEGAGSPYAVPVTNEASFFRLRLPSGGPFDFRYLAPTFTTSIGDPFGCGCTSPENPNSLVTGGNPQDTGQGSVFLHTGELTQHALDLSIPGRGFDWKFERRYRSGMQYDGPLGQGWDFNYNQRLAMQANGDVLRVDGLGRVDRYVFSGGAYQSPSGFYTRLVRNLDGTFDERDRHGTVDSYSATNTLGIAKLTRVRDRNGNQMTFDYNTLGQLTNVLETLGRAIAYSYDSSGRLTQVTDFTGRTLQFGYDANGDLAGVTSPPVTGTPTGNDFPLGKTTRYTYSSGFGDARLNHNLLTVTAPNEVVVSGPPWLVAQYDTNPTSTNVDRLVSLFLGGTNASGVSAGGAISYTYTGLGSAPSNDFSTAVFQTVVTNRNGNAAEYRVNQLGNIVRQIQFTRGLRPGEPPGFTNQFEYNRDGETTRRINPEGDSVENTYDSGNADRFQQGNLLMARRLPGPRGGDQAQLLTAYTYEPLFNQVRTMTDPRGNDPAYVPPNGGANTPGRYTQTNYFDYQESAAVPAEATAWGIGIPAALLGLGDLNDDGLTTQADGQLVRHDEPVVNLLPDSNQALVEGDTEQEIITRYTYNQFGQLIRTEEARGNIHTFSYFPENDPDGDGLDLIAGRDPTTGGYPREQVRDAVVGPRRLDPLPVAAITNRFQRDRVGNLSRLTDGRNNTTLYTYNTLNQVVQQEKPKVDPSQTTGYLTRYLYDANDNRTGLDIQNVTADPTDHLPVLVASHPFFQHRFSYDILDQLVEQVQDATRDPVIPPSGQPETLTTHYRYDGNGNQARVISPLAVNGADPDNYKILAYDERDLLYAATRGGASPQASTWTYDYDGNENLARWTDAEDNDATPGPESEVTSYDGFDRRRSVVDRGGNERRFTYDPAGRTVREDSFGRATVGATTNALLSRTAHLFDEIGREFQADHALFLAAGVTQQVAAVLLDGPLTPGDGNVSDRSEYDALSRLTFRVDDTAAVYRYEYDGAGRRIRETLPLVDNLTAGGPYPTKTEYEYDRNNNVVRRTETHSSPQGLLPPAQLPYLDVFDALDRTVRFTDPLGQTRYLEYDSRDNVVASFDARGPLIADPFGLYTSGNINDRGNVTRYAYDGLRRPWREEKELTTTGDGGDPRDLTNPFNPDGLVTLQTERDANSRVTSRTDDTANRTLYAYDALNRRVAQTNADGGWRTFSYNRDHDRIGERDENNTSHTFVYDGLGRLVSHQLTPDPAKTNAAGLPMLTGTTLQTFAYDGLSRLIRSTDNNDPADANDDWVVETRYDSLGRVVEELQNGRSAASGYVSDDRTELHYPAGNRVLHFGYDAHHQLVALSNSTTVAITASLLGAACPPAILCTFAPSNLAPSLVVTQSFNANRRLTQIEQLSSPLGKVGFHTFTRDRENDVTAAMRLATAGVNTFQENLSLALDSEERQKVFGAQLNGSGGGSFTVRQQMINGAQDVREVRDQFNQVAQQNSYSPTHEIEGGFFLNNGSPGTGIRTRDTNFVYQWDGLNRLRVVRERAAPANIVARYAYDASPAIHGGRRVQKTYRTPGPPGTNTLRFYYDRANCIEETVVGDGEQVARQFIFGNRADEVLAMDADTNGDGQPDQLSFFLRDHNNNVTQLVDANGQPVEFYFYDYRGQPLLFNAVTGLPLTNSFRGNPWLFTGQRWDAETGLSYYKARYYDPAYGVFLSRDPMGAWHDAANDGNGMALAALNSWNHRDPTGLGPSAEEVKEAIEKLKEAKEKLEKAKEKADLLADAIKALGGDEEAKKRLLNAGGDAALEKALAAAGVGGLWVKIIKEGMALGCAIGHSIAASITDIVCLQKCQTCMGNWDLIPVGKSHQKHIIPGFAGADPASPRVADCYKADTGMYTLCTFKRKLSTWEECGSFFGVVESTYEEWVWCGK